MLLSGLDCITDSPSRTSARRSAVDRSWWPVLGIAGVLLLSGAACRTAAAPTTSTPPVASTSASQPASANADDEGSSEPEPEASPEPSGADAPSESEPVGDPPTTRDEPWASDMESDGPDEPRRRHPSFRTHYQDEIRSVVRAHIDDVRRCYDAERSGADLSERITVHFTIGPRGDVTRARGAADEAVDEPVARCLAVAVKEWKFPAPEGGKEVDITYPFIFAAS